MNTASLVMACLIGASGDPSSYDGFNNVPWGSSPEVVRQTVPGTAAGGGPWQPDQTAPDEFPKELGVTVFRSSGTIAGYPANVRYYFWDGKFFQATVQFPFNDLVKYDFNYNVFRSVNEYYNAIRSRTLVFTASVYDLLRKKYGKQKPYFRELDPRGSFVELDKYLKQERWNLRYHPYDFYQRIVTQSYARWDFPKTRALFSISISAPEKRFDYTLSLTSLDLSARINAVKDSLKMRGL
ncbi:MAG: hypothetical protein MUF22_09505 [Chitinispirillaceae bacterium]|nr:hypothetical protein [Chitinispirillaceae bacterium]